jgi:hypothetical protein
MALSVETRQWLYGLTIIILVTIVGMLLALQGWRSRPPAFDMLTYFNRAEALLKQGTLPRYGDISSYGSFSPPGTAWLIAPGMLVLNDPRLYEKLGSGLLYLGTLLGIFLLARAALGIRCAYLSVALYGLSGLGLYFAGSLWPIGHPFFYVWMVYFAVHWVTRRDARYLAAAAVIWAVGMVVDMAIAPAALVLPALWLIYRPPLWSRVHLIAAALALAVWFPYLQFEMDRGFADLRSQLLRQNIFPGHYKETWCDPNLTVAYVSTTSTPSQPDSNEPEQAQGGGATLLDRLLRRGRRIVEGIPANFDQAALFPGAGLLLALVSLSSLAVLSLARTEHSVAPSRLGDQTKTRVWALGLVVPWLILVAVAEAGRPERFFWLWPLQAIALAAFIANIIVRLPLPSPARWLGQMLLVGAVLIAPIQSYVNAWLRDGWAGADAEEVYVVDYVADQLRSEGRAQAAIGYQILFYEFMPRYNVLDRQYKVGAELDFVMKHRHGIANTDQCAEGVSPDDEYRIVQTRPKSTEWQPRAYFNVPLDQGFRLLRRFDLYEVFRRVR